jgi:hypothetical protein
MNTRIYYNLNKRCLSIQEKRRNAKGQTFWKVVRYAGTIGIKDAAFLVSEAGRQRTIKEQRKNVHAKVEGKMFTFVPNDIAIPTTRVFYNPYKAAHFVDADGNKITKAKFAFVKGDASGYSIHVTQ